MRAGPVDGMPGDGRIPAWLMRRARAPGRWFRCSITSGWSGVVVLARPPVARRLDWEDFDLLRVAGRQLASYLAEQASQDALGDAQRFDEFNRRIAFIMHDIKNLASQLALLARNAERHADNPEFRADMLLTLRNSADKLKALLARLGRYGAHGGEAPRAGRARRRARRASPRATPAQHQVVVVERDAVRGRWPTARRSSRRWSTSSRTRSRRAPPDAPVFLDVRASGAARRSIEVIDRGAGMSPEFVRTRLFKPFVSTKPGGFGIGAFEARELIRAMGGRLEVESREGLGTRFRIRLPLAGAAGLIRSIHSHKTEVA